VEVLASERRRERTVGQRIAVANRAIGIKGAPACVGLFGGELGQHSGAHTRLHRRARLTGSARFNWRTCALAHIGKDQYRAGIFHLAGHAASQTFEQSAVIRGDEKSPAIGTDGQVPKTVLGLEVTRKVTSRGFAVGSQR